MLVKKLRKQLGLTQKQAAQLVNIPLRTYVSYENDKDKEGSIKNNYIKEKFEKYGLVDEEHGVLSIQKIKEATQSILSNYDADYCYLFGSYAKGTATEKSDVDLLISTPVSGMKFYGLIETLRTQLKKKVEVITASSLKESPTLIEEILKGGIKIYG